MTPSRRSPRQLAAALAPLREAWTPQTLLAEIQRAWPEVVGELIAAEASPTSERAGVLTVACSAAVWAHELDLMGVTIVERLNAHLRGGRVSRLRCVVAA